MATPTIIIGLGTSGLRVIENVQKYYYENYGENKPANVEYLYLETAESERPLETPAGNNIERAYISLSNLATMVEGINKRCGNPKWLPDARTIVDAGKGAAGVRSCGRLALWGKNDDGDNFKNVIDCIKSAHTKVTHIANNESSTNLLKPTVFVTGSLTGGTGSGVFIDFGYLVRDIIKDITNLYGLFLLPSNPTNITDNGVSYGNAYGAILDLDYYNKKNSTYNEKWPNGKQVSEAKPPYELVQYISQDYKDGSPAISNLGGLYKMAGLYLFLNIAGINHKRDVRLVDCKANEIMGKYGTFGLSAIQYPKDNIQDFIASQLSINLLKRLTNSKEYYRKGQPQPNTIIRGDIRSSISARMDDILMQAFDSLNITGNSDLQREMRNETVKIGNNNFPGNKIEYVISLFSSKSDDKFYSKVSGNMLTAQKIIVDGIYEMVDKSLQNSENLYFTKFTLEDIAEYIGKLINYWKTLGLADSANNWDNKLRKDVEDSVKNTYKIILQQDNVILDRFQNILEQMKMHLSFSILENIQNHITKEGKIKLEGSKGKNLPKIAFFDKLIDDLKKIIGSTDNRDDKDDSETSKYNFERRKRNILGEINDLTLPILRVYPSNDFKEECKNGMLIYERDNNGKVRSLIRLKKGADFNLLNYFSEKQSGKFYQEIYIDLLKEYRNKIEKSNCVEDYDILTFINQNQGNKAKCIGTANRAASPFISINGDLSTDEKLPNFIVCNDIHTITNIISDFGNELKFKDTPDGKLELPHLKNIIVFYSEKPINNPLKDITYINQMKDVYERCPDGTTDNATWNNKRKAYLTDKK